MAETEAMRFDGIIPEEASEEFQRKNFCVILNFGEIENGELAPYTIVVPKAECIESDEVRELMPFFDSCEESRKMLCRYGNQIKTTTLEYSISVTETNDWLVVDGILRTSEDLDQYIEKMEVKKGDSISVERERTCRIIREGLTYAVKEGFARISFLGYIPAVVSATLQLLGYIIVTTDYLEYSDIIIQG